MLPTFKNPDLLETALTHRSSLNENISKSSESNERFEYLGDAVLELATTNFLFEKFPKKPEGELTAFRSALVRTTTLAEAATDIGLGEKLHMSKGEESSGGRTNTSLLANSFEALIGAIYLDQGFEKVVEFLNQKLFPKFEKIYKEGLYRDAKSTLQEVVQAKNLGTPSYKSISSHGPDHDKVFTVAVLVNGEEVATGKGKSKQIAQQAAAKKALEKYQN